MVNLLQTDSYQSRTLSAAIHRFAPPPENNTAAYIRFVEDKAGVPRHSRLSDLSPQELLKVAQAKAVYEGWKGEKLVYNPDIDQSPDHRPSRERVVEVAAEEREEKPSRRPRRAEHSEPEGAQKSLKDRFAQQADDRPATNREVKEAAPATQSPRQAFQDRYAEAQDKPAAQQTDSAPASAPAAKYEQIGFNEQGFLSAATHYADEGAIKVARNAAQDFAPAAAGTPTPPANTPKPTTPAPAFRPEEHGWNG